MGEAMDIRQGTPLTAQPVSVYAGTYESAAGSNIVIITSGIPRKPGQTRMDLAQTNVNVIKDIAPADHQVLPGRHLYHRFQPGGHPHLRVPQGDEHPA